MKAIVALKHDQMH